jgi:hypothetical protein
MDAPVGVSFTNPNAFYDKVTERWTLFVVNAANGDLLWTTSKAKELDGTDDWNALRKVTIDGYPDIQSADLRRLNGGWVGIILAPGGLHVIQSKGILPSQGFSAATGQAIPTVAAGKHDAIGRPTWLPLSDGSMDVWYQASLAGVPHVFRTKLTGPFPPLDYKDYYGPWAKIFTVYDENQDNAPSQVELNSQAQRNLTGRNPVPIEVRIPDNSSVRMDRGIGIDELVPGVQINLLATMNLRKISQLQKLHSVTVTETAEDGENVQITLVPATRPDSDVEVDS